MRFAGVCVVLVLGVAFVHSAAPLSKGKLKFKVSGRNLPDKDNIGTTDGYFEVFSSSDGGKNRKQIGKKSDTISDQENPDWGNVYEFDFDRSKNEQWYFKIYDDDSLRTDDDVGRVWVNVNDYVDKGQLVYAHLNKKGYLIIKSVDQQSPIDPNTPIGTIPLPPGTPTTQTLRFKLSATGLPTKDDVGFIPGNSDPYVIVTVAEGISGKEKDVGRSATVSSTRNPQWGDIFTVNWDYKKDQRLHFAMYDDDNLREDDKLGSGWLELNDFVAGGQAKTVLLPKKAAITITRA
jgi:hypothetical protein